LKSPFESGQPIGWKDTTEGFLLAMRFPGSALPGVDRTGLSIAGWNDAG